MMTNPFERLTLVLTVDPSGLVTGFRTGGDAVKQFRDQATEHLRQVQNEMRAVGTAAKEMGAQVMGALTLVAAAITGLAVRGIKGLIDMESALNRLQVATGATTEQWAKMGTQAQEVTRRIAEMSGIMQSQLLSAMAEAVFRGNSFAQSQYLVGVAAAIATARHKEFSTVLMALERAQYGSYIQLTRLGLATRDDIKNRTDLNVIIDRNIAKIKDQTFSQQSLQTQIGILNVRIQELAETLVTQLGPGLETFLRYAKSAVIVLTDIVGHMDPAQKNIMLVVAAVLSLNTVFRLMNGILGIELLPTIGNLLPRALGLLTGGFKLLWASLQAIINIRSEWVLAMSAIRGAVLSTNAIVFAIVAGLLALAAAVEYVRSGAAKANAQLVQEQFGGLTPEQLAGGALFLPGGPEPKSRDRSDRAQPKTPGQLFAEQIKKDLTSAFGGLGSEIAKMMEGVLKPFDKIWGDIDAGAKKASDALAKYVQGLRTHLPQFGQAGSALQQFGKDLHQLAIDLERGAISLDQFIARARAALAKLRGEDLLKGEQEVARALQAALSKSIEANRAAVEEGSKSFAAAVADMQTTLNKVTAVRAPGGRLLLTQPEIDEARRKFEGAVVGMTRTQVEETKKAVEDGRKTWADGAAEIQRVMTAALGVVHGKAQETLLALQRSLGTEYIKRYVSDAMAYFDGLREKGELSFADLQAGMGRVNDKVLSLAAFFGITGQALANLQALAKRDELKQLDQEIASMVDHLRNMIEAGQVSAEQLPAAFKQMEDAVVAFAAKVGLADDKVRDLVRRLQQTQEVDLLKRAYMPEEDPRLKLVREGTDKMRQIEEEFATEGAKLTGNRLDQQIAAENRRFVETSRRLTEEMGLIRVAEAEKRQLGQEGALTDLQVQQRFDALLEQAKRDHVEEMRRIEAEGTVRRAEQEERLGFITRAQLEATLEAELASLRKFGDTSSDYYLGVVGKLASLYQKDADEYIKQIQIETKGNLDEYVKRLQAARDYYAALAVDNEAYAETARKIGEELATAQERLLVEQQKPWNDFFNGVTNSFTGFFSEILSGTKNITDAWNNMVKGLLNAWAKGLDDMVSHYITNFLTKIQNESEAGGGGMLGGVFRFFQGLFGYRAPGTGGPPAAASVSSAGAYPSQYGPEIEGVTQEAFRSQAMAGFAEAAPVLATTTSDAIDAAMGGMAEKVGSVLPTASPLMAVIPPFQAAVGTLQAGSNVLLQAAQRLLTGALPGAGPGAGPTVPGLLEPGTIDAFNRPKIPGPGGTYSTLRTITITEDGKAVLLPTAIGGKLTSNEEAIAHYRATGEHLGIFDTEAHATAYDRLLHERIEPGSYDRLRTGAGGFVGEGTRAAEQDSVTRLGDAATKLDVGSGKLDEGATKGIDQVAQQQAQGSTIQTTFQNVAEMLTQAAKMLMDAARQLVEAATRIGQGKPAEGIPAGGAPTTGPAPSISSAEAYPSQYATQQQVKAADQLITSSDKIDAAVGAQMTNISKDADNLAVSQTSMGLFSNAAPTFQEAVFLLRQAAEMLLQAAQKMIEASLPSASPAELLGGGTPSLGTFSSTAGFIPTGVGFQGVAGALASGLGGFAHGGIVRAVQHFAQGGVVDGPPGEPVAVVAHAGERVLTPIQRAVVEHLVPSLQVGGVVQAPTVGQPTPVADAQPIEAVPGTSGTSYGIVQLSAMGPENQMVVGGMVQQLLEQMAIAGKFAGGGIVRNVAAMATVPRFDIGGMVREIQMYHTGGHVAEPSGRTPVEHVVASGGMMIERVGAGLREAVPSPSWFQMGGTVQVPVAAPGVVVPGRAGTPVPMVVHAGDRVLTASDQFVSQTQRETVLQSMRDRISDVVRPGVQVMRQIVSTTASMVVPHFQGGGIVPVVGPASRTPVQIIAHAGERIITPEEQATEVALPRTLGRVVEHVRSAVREHVERTVEHVRAVFQGGGVVRAPEGSGPGRPMVPFASRGVAARETVQGVVRTTDRLQEIASVGRQAIIGAGETGRATLGSGASFSESVNALFHAGAPVTPAAVRALSVSPATMLRGVAPVLHPTFAGAFQFGGIVRSPTGASVVPILAHDRERFLGPTTSTADTGTASMAEGGGDVHVHFEVSAIDAAGVQAFFARNARTVADAVMLAGRNNHMFRRVIDRASG